MKLTATVLVLTLFSLVANAAPYQNSRCGAYAMRAALGLGQEVLSLETLSSSQEDRPEFKANVDNGKKLTYTLTMTSQCIVESIILEKK